MLQDGYALAFRPVVVEDIEYPVSRMRAELPAPPDTARPLFEFLTTPAGFEVIDPAGVDFEESRAASVLCAPTVPRARVAEQVHGELRALLVIV